MRPLAFVLTVMTVVCTVTDSIADEVEHIPLDRLPKLMLYNAEMLDHEKQFVGARKVTRDGRQVIFVDSMDKAGQWEDFFTADGEYLGGHRVVWREKTRNEILKAVFEFVLICVIPAGIAAVIARWLVRRAVNDPSVVQEWLCAWLGASVACFVAIAIAATIQRWGSILDWANFLISLGLVGVSIASLAECFLLAVDWLRRGRRVGRHAYVLLVALCVSPYAILFFKAGHDEQSRVERRREQIFKHSALDK